MKKSDLIIIANKKFKSRLIVGTGKYKNFKETAQAVKESGADMVTVAVRRVNITNKKKLNIIIEFIIVQKKIEDELIRIKLFYIFYFNSFEMNNFINVFDNDQPKICFISFGVFLYLTPNSFSAIL